VPEGLRGEDSIADLCRREGIASSMYYGWSKKFLEAGKRRNHDRRSESKPFAGDTAQAATSDEVKDLRLRDVGLEMHASDAVAVQEQRGGRLCWCPRRSTESPAVDRRPSFRAFRNLPWRKSARGRIDPRPRC
jgi:transposase